MAKLFLSISILAGLLACNNRQEVAPTGTNGPDSAVAAQDGGRTTPTTLELVYLDSTFQLTGVAKKRGGGLWVSYPRWNGPYQYGVIMAAGLDSVQPYPNAATNLWSAGEGGQDKWVCVQAVYTDDSNRLWVLDPAAPQMKKITGGGAKLVKMRDDGTMERVYTFNGVVTDTSYVNDVRVDVARDFAYITDSKTGGIVVLNLTTGQAREVLRGHSSTLSDPAFQFMIDGKELTKERKPVKINSDGIALTPDGVWLYYKPLTDDKLYRIATEHLRNWNLDDTALGTKVEDLGHFNTTDGMIFDKAGNLYMGDLQNSSIVRLDKSHRKTVLVKDARLLWPDSYSMADGYLYISCSQIHKQPEFNTGFDGRASPYTVYRVKL